MGQESKIRLGEFAVEALDGTSARGVEHLRQQTAYAIRYYLTDKDSGRPEWAYPDFLRTEDDSQKLELTLALDEDLWGSLEEEAERQGVSPELLAQHAVLYFVADREAGRVPQRIRAA